MAKTLVDIDDALLTLVAEALGTKTKKDTVNAALAEVLRIRRVDAFFELARSGAFADALDPEIRASMWR